jgi:hypothetical protein
VCVPGSAFCHYSSRVYHAFRAAKGLCKICLYRKERCAVCYGERVESLSGFARNDGSFGMFQSPNALVVEKHADLAGREYDDVKKEMSAVPCMRQRFFFGLQNCVSVERMERVRHPKSFTMDVRDGEDERRVHVHARKEARTTLWNSIYHSLSSSFVNGRSESAVVKTWESRRSVPLGVAVRTSAQAEDIDEQTLLQLMPKSVVELDPLSKASECPSETRS